jgi:hypothetical protein
MASRAQSACLLPLYSAVDVSRQLWRMEMPWGSWCSISLTILKLRVHARSRYSPGQFLLSQHVHMPLYSTVDISRQSWRCPEAPGVQSAWPSRNWEFMAVARYSPGQFLLSQHVLMPLCFSRWYSRLFWTQPYRALSVQCVVSLTVGCAHKVRKYLEFHSVCPLVGIGCVYPPPPPPTKGRAHSPAGERVV